MHIQTHILSGWCLGNLIPFTARERAFCMLAASLPDIDGLGMIAGGVEQHWYWDYHHKLAHNLLFGVVMSAALALLSKNRWRAAAVYLGLFHLHLLADYFGSGPGWPIHYLWPFSDEQLMNWQAWNLFSWQNLSTFAVLLLWTIGIMLFKRRTPLEAVMPSLDRQIVAMVRGRQKSRAMQAP